MALTIRLSPDEEALIEILKEKLGIGSASRALIKSADIVVNKLTPLQQELFNEQKAHKEMKQKFFELRDLIKSKLHAEQKIAIVCGLDQSGSQPGEPGNCNHSSGPRAAAELTTDCSFSFYMMISMDELKAGDKVFLLDMKGKPVINTVESVDLLNGSFQVEEHSYTVHPDLPNSLIILT